MNTQLVEYLAQMLQSLTGEEQALLEEKVQNKKDESQSKNEQTGKVGEHVLYERATPQERAKAFREWVESHRGHNFPSLSDEDISRESIYGERG